MFSRNDLRLPLQPSWSITVGFDTGAYMSALFGIQPPESPDIFITDEFPNYHYVSGEPERLDISDSEWARQVRNAHHDYRPGLKCKGWVDSNSQFKEELKHHKLYLRSNFRGLELRVEISRSYFQSGHCWLAPWLTVLPYELELAKWPDEHTSAGKYVRLKQHDHTLDCLEHILSRKPRAARMIEPKRESFVDRFMRENRFIRPTIGDPHLGSL